MAFDTDPLILLGYCLAGGATIAGVIRFWPASRPAMQPAPAAAPPLAARVQWPEATLPIYPYEKLLEQTGTASLIDLARQDCGLNAATWTEFLLPVIQNVAELLQMLPASESHHHAQPGGLWIHTCETVRYVIRLRQGTILPSGRDAEDQQRHRHRWTAGVIIAALLHDVGKTLSDLRVRLYGPNHRAIPWNALTGDMLDTQATDYAVDFPKASERDYQAHQRDGILLMQRLVPSPTLVWIGEDPPLLEALMQYLSGEAGGTDNQIAALVSRAEAESVKLNLLVGPRTRFSTARTVPLIERLMDALRRMLADGGYLPLNRPGAAGYVFQGDMWFAGARLANAVREYLRENESSIGIPGEDKNDRLFDVWQDYGACRTNPASNRALWSGRVTFAGGASYDLPAMLRFPLDRLYSDPNQYPADLPGDIQALAQTPPVAGPQDATPAVPTPMVTPSPAPAKPAITPTPAQPAATPLSAEVLPSLDQPSSAPVSTPLTTVSDTPGNAPHVPSSAPDNQATPAPEMNRTNEFLDSQDAASRADFSDPPEPGASLQPVKPALPLPSITTKTGLPAAGPEALAFMAWVQQGVSDGSLPYNAAGALVHFVRYKEDAAMLLVSPLIFRRFDEARGVASPPGVMPGQAVQRAVTAAGWHQRGAGGKNVVSYQVMRKGARGGNLLNGFLVLQPERFFSPVPQTNDRLVFWGDSEPTHKEKDKC